MCHQKLSRMTTAQILKGYTSQEVWDLHIKTLKVKQVLVSSSSFLCKMFTCIVSVYLSQTIKSKIYKGINH